MANKNNISEMYECVTCQFKTNKKGNFNAHIRTNKHKMMMVQSGHYGGSKMFECECGKVFSARQSLSRHRKTCNGIYEAVKDPVIENNIVQTLIDENKEMRDIVKQQNDLIKEQQAKMDEAVVPVQNVTTNINNNFNVNLFLNEQCKDAISIHNFVQNMTLGFKELERIGDAGFVNGMISILTDNLGTLDVYKRPMHCTDLKREILYFKHGDRWERDTDEKTEMRKLVKAIEDKNYDTVLEWQQEHPDAFNCDTDENQKYLKLMSESLGITDDETENARISKILKQVVKEVYIGK